MTNNGNRVFVSSTIHDLIDVRSEVLNLLNQQYYLPIMSDQHESEFDVIGTKNNIETCLENVRSSNIVLVVLSQRYGSTLEKYGYDNISFTHLEYRTARASHKRIYFFVRDRLLAKYNMFKESGETIDTVDDVNLRGLFQVIDEHEKVENEQNHSDWVHVFSSSVDLKETLSSRLRSHSVLSKLRRLQEDNAIPLVSASLDLRECKARSGKILLRVIFKNIGSLPLVNGIVDILETGDQYSIEGLSPGSNASVRENWNTEDMNDKGLYMDSEVMLTYAFSYDTFQGIRIKDTYSVVYKTSNFPKSYVRLISRDFIGASQFILGSSTDIQK